MELPPEYRAWFKNFDGSCVQCSNGMVGMHINRPEWTFLLWDTLFAELTRGASNTTAKFYKVVAGVQTQVGTDRTLNSTTLGSDAPMSLLAHDEPS